MKIPFVWDSICGAYQGNNARSRGLLNEHEHPNVENMEIIQKTNEKLERRIEKLSQSTK